MPVKRVSRSLLLSVAIVSTALLAAATLFSLHLEHTVSRTTLEVRRAHELGFTLERLTLPPNSGFAPLLAAADLHAAAQLGDHIFLSGSGELFDFTSSGALAKRYHVGTNLPSFPLGQITTGRLHNNTAPQLLIATSGAGLLILDPSSGNLQQLLPNASNLRDITAVAALPNGDLLLGTRRSGVLRFDGETLSLYRPEYRNVAVTTILPTADSVWVGTQADGLLITRAGVTQHLQAEMPDPHVEALTAHGYRVFAATPDGVAEFQDGKLARTLAPGIFAHALFADDHELTIATLEGDTVSVPLEAAHAQVAPSAQPTSDNTQQFLSLPGGLYAVRPHGLFRRTGAVWSPALPVPSATLTDRNIAALAFAADGGLWVGYFDQGLDLLSANLDNPHHLEDDHLFCINRISMDPKRGTMAVATANGLVLFDRAGRPRQVLGTRDGLISEHVTDIAFSDKTMTLATPAGLTFISSSGVESLYAFQGLVNNHVYSIAASPDGRLLAGTLGGLSLLEHASVLSNLNASNSHLRHNWISAVLPLPGFAGGGYLLGSYGGGLMQLTGAAQVATMPGAPQSAVINPNALLSTASHVFAGSLGQGLWSFGRTSGRWQQIVAGLPSLNVTALAAHDGQLFVGTDNGLVHIAEAQLPE